MRVLDLFHGAGGVACGLDALRVDHVGVEWHEPAAAVARAAGHRVVVGDVRDPAVLGEAVGMLGGVDLVWASPPCQAWSTAGQRKGAQDERNGWPWTIDALDHLGCPPVVAENVTGMLQHSGEGHPDPERCPACYVARWLLPRLRERYSHVKLRTLDAADLGVPQHRRRVIIQARHDAIRWPTLTHGQPGSMFVAAGLRQPWRTVRDALGSDALHIRAENTGATARPDTKPARAASEPQRLDAPAPTVTTTEANGTRGRHMGAKMRSGATRGGVDRASDALWLATGRRRLTVDECAALQSSPDGYPWHAAGTKSEAYKAVGNAVPPPMAAALVGVYL